MSALSLPLPPDASWSRGVNVPGLPSSSSSSSLFAAPHALASSSAMRSPPPEATIVLVESTLRFFFLRLREGSSDRARIASALRSEPYLAAK